VLTCNRCAVAGHVWTSLTPAIVLYSSLHFLTLSEAPLLIMWMEREVFCRPLPGLSGPCWGRPSFIKQPAAFVKGRSKECCVAAYALLRWTLRGYGDIVTFDTEKMMSNSPTQRCSWYPENVATKVGYPTHNILQGQASRLFSTGKRASNSIQDPRHVGFLSALNWSFLVLYSEETLRSLLKTL
jgi:hypothetical protein